MTSISIIFTMFRKQVQKLDAKTSFVVYYLVLLHFVVFFFYQVLASWRFFSFLALFLSSLQFCDHYAVTQLVRFLRPILYRNSFSILHLPLLRLMLVFHNNFFRQTFLFTFIFAFLIFLVTVFLQRQSFPSPPISFPPVLSPTRRFVAVGIFQFHFHFHRATSCFRTFPSDCV